MVLVLQITQNERDEELMKTIISYLGSGVIQRDPGNNALNVKVSSFSFIYEKIIPLFREHPIMGVKSEDFED